MTDSLLADQQIVLKSGQVMHIIGLVILTAIVIGMFFVGFREEFKKRGK